MKGTLPPPEHIKPWLDIVQGTGTVLALVAGAYWFFLQRGTAELIKLEHTVTQRPLEGAQNRTLITLDVRVTNAGKVKVDDLHNGKVNVFQLNPTGKTEPLISFPLQDVKLEPGESDQALFQTVVVTSSVKTIQISSSYPVPKARNLSWSFVSAADIGLDKNVRQSESQLSAVQPTQSTPATQAR